MGQGYGYKCNCGYEGEILFGVGFGYWQDSKKLLEDMAKGKYGRKRADIVKNKKNIVVDAEYYYYRCSCGYGNSYKSLNLYQSDYDDVYWLYDKPENSYKLIMGFKHRCPKCREVMKRISEEEFDLDYVSCPKCGNNVPLLINILWD